MYVFINYLCSYKEIKIHYVNHSTSLNSQNHLNTCCPWKSPRELNHIFSGVSCRLPKSHSHLHILRLIDALLSICVGRNSSRPSASLPTCVLFKSYRTSFNTNPIIVPSASGLEFKAESFEEKARQYRSLFYGLGSAKGGSSSGGLKFWRAQDMP